MERLKELIRFYMRQYGYTRWEAIQSIKTDLRTIAETES